METLQNKMRIYQIELTNYCNATCSYCPHSKMKRTKGYISMDTIDTIIDYMKSINQNYVALHHMGEPLLHPEVGNIIEKFTLNGIRTEFSTNGLMLKKKNIDILLAGISLVRIAVDEFYNRPGYIQTIQNFLELAKSFDTKIRIHTVVGNDLTPFKNYENGSTVILENKTLDNWAGQVDGMESKMLPAQECYFTDHNYVVVLWDGTVAQCCLDYDGRFPLGTISTINKMQVNNPSPLCKNCKKLQFADGGEWQL